MSDNTNSTDRKFTFREVVAVAKGDAVLFYKGSVLIGEDLFTEDRHSECPCELCQICEGIRLSGWSGIISASAIEEAALHLKKMSELLSAGVNN